MDLKLYKQEKRKKIKEKETNIADVAKNYFGDIVKVKG